MGSCCIKEEMPSRSGTDHQSIFIDMKDTNKLDGRFPYQKEYNIGPYMESNQSEKRIIKWKDLHKRSSKKKKKNNTEDQNLYLVNKIDQMLYEISVNNQESFFNNIMIGGPPSALRWGVWKNLLYKNVKYVPNLYEDLIEHVESSQDYDQILKDTLRTFPKEKYFSHAEEKGQSIGHRQLLNVLCAISLYFPDSYCQSMNFILGFLIMVSGGNEIDVFWSFISLVKSKNFLIIGLYEPGMPLLQFLMDITGKLMTKHIPAIKDVFEELMVPDGFWLVKWYMTMFIYAFPVPICIRIWDYVLKEGVFGLVYIIIPILRHFTKYIMDMQLLDDFEDFQELTRDEKNLTDPESQYYMDMNEIIKEAETYTLKKKEIVKMAKQYLKENQHINNDYVQLFTQYDNDKVFTKKVTEFISPKMSDKITNGYSTIIEESSQIESSVVQSQISQQKNEEDLQESEIKKQREDKVKENNQQSDIETQMNDDQTTIAQ